jgi:hypothetical protein
VVVILAARTLCGLLLVRPLAGPLVLALLLLALTPLALLLFALRGILVRVSVLLRHG